MDIITSLEQHITDQPVILTIGKFDSVHRGHQALIRRVVERAHAQGAHSAVMTFDPHPYTVLFPDRPIQLLTSIEERAELIAPLGVDMLLVVPFTRETMNTPADEYMRQLCQAFPLRELWVGETFALGRHREGTIPRLQEIGRELGYSVHALPRMQLGEMVISTSRVRQLLNQGKVEEMEPLLGRPFELRGIVEVGDRRGQRLGFPTVNLAVPPDHAIPADGVYACRIFLADEQHFPRVAVTNIGMRPTFAGVRRTIEAHILDWYGDVYHQRVRVQFLHYLRGEQRFQNVEGLIAQIRRDIEQTRRLLLHLPTA